MDYRKIGGERIVGSALILIAVYQVKRYYSGADSEALAWIIGPTARLVELISGITFTPLAGVGWVSYSHEALIAPSCAGVNFLIILFCMSSFQIVFSDLPCKAWLPAIIIGTLAACGVTIVVNGLRIWLSVLLYQADICSGWFSAEMVHRLAGVFIYYLFVCCYYLMIAFVLRYVSESHVSERMGNRRFRDLIFCLIPLFWYLLFVLGIPFLNRGYQHDPDSFMIHGMVVLVVSILTTMMLVPLFFRDKWQKT
ncbi:MAG: exosortase K [Proteobacteria bacterium]|nr:MAG: exosortase K [Pseudomonadota bacterium]